MLHHAFASCNDLWTQKCESPSRVRIIDVVGPGGIGTGTRIGPSNFRLIGTSTTPGPTVHGPVPVQPFSNFNRYFHANFWREFKL